MSVDIAAIHHFTVGCAPGDLPALLDFYAGKLGLKDGYRPGLRYPGHWLYAGGHAILHLNALHRTTPARGSGSLDHIALQARGLVATRQALQAANVPFIETPLKGTSLHQMFVEDPLGLKVELNFDLATEDQTVSAAG